MPASYSHTTRASGLTLTADVYNADHLNHIAQGPSTYDDYSSNATQMQSVADPGEVGTESLATSLAGELERLRFMIKEITGEAQWYATANTTLKKLGALALITRGAALNIPDTTWTAMTWDTHTHDDEGWWTSGAPTRFTAPYASLVQVTWQICWAANTAGVRNIYTFFNGSEPVAPAASLHPAPSAGGLIQSATGYFVMAAGDYLECMLSQSSGAPLALQPSYCFAALTVIA